MAMVTPAEARWKKTQQAVGAVNRGRLHHPSKLHNSRGVKLRFPKNSWGTRRMVDLLQQCTKLVRKRHRGAHRLLVGDLSRKRGGRLKPHAGHQNGREADIGFYMKLGKPLGGLWRVSARQIDARRTLTLVQCFISSGDLMNIFLDRALQPPLVKEAKRRGWSRSRIAKTFSWPRGRRSRRGWVQHRNGHWNHMHVRLKCARHERRCVTRVASRRRARRAKSQAREAKMRRHRARRVARGR